MSKDDLHMRRVPVQMVQKINGVTFHLYAEVIFGDLEDNGRGEARVLPPYVHNLEVKDMGGNVITEKLTESTHTALIDLAISGASHVY